MATQETVSQYSAPDSSVYQQLEEYPWDSDPEFQGGLSAILGPNASPEQASELSLRARCFYYSRRYNVDVDFDSYKAWRQQNHAPPPSVLNGTSNANSASHASASEPVTTATAPTTQPDAPYPTSFAQIVELITTGQPIPGIRDIPNTVLEGQGTQPVKAKRKKPWEKDSSDAAPVAQST